MVTRSATKFRHSIDSMAVLIRLYNISLNDLWMANTLGNDDAKTKWKKFLWHFNN